MYALKKRKRIDAHIHHGGEKDAIDKCPGFKEIIWTGEFSEEEMKKMTYTTSTGVMARLRQVLNLEPWPAIGDLKLEHLIESMDRANVVYGDQTSTPEMIPPTAMGLIFIGSIKRIIRMVF